MRKAIDFFRKPENWLLAIAVCGFVQYGSTKGWVRVYNADAEARYLVDNGSYATNDYVHINLTRSALLPDTADFYVYRRHLSQTNDADWVQHFTTTVGRVSFPTNIPFANAWSNNWLTGTSYVRSQTHTNGVAVIIWAQATTNALVPIRTGVYRGAERLFPKLTTESQANEN